MDLICSSIMIFFSPTSNGPKVNQMSAGTGLNLTWTGSGTNKNNKKCINGLWNMFTTKFKFNSHVKS